MRQCSYRDFSLRRSVQPRASGLTVCHFELTYRCNLACEHCQSACFSVPAAVRRELSTKQVLEVLDKLRSAGVLWLTLSGGDPLCRPDFPEIYSHAKRCGFLITVLSNGLGLTPRIAEMFAKQPPFRVEATLNAVSPARHDKISGAKGVLPRIKRNLKLLRRCRVPLLLKTQLTASNRGQLAGLKKFAAGLKVPLQISGSLNARLNGDGAPCLLRLEPREYASLYLKNIKAGKKAAPASGPASPFFCGVFSGHGIGLDAYGDVFLCDMIRRPKCSLLRLGVRGATSKAKAFLLRLKFSAKSKCRYCAGLGLCGWCPGQAYLERANPLAPLDYYCRIWEAASK